MLDYYTFQTCERDMAQRDPCNTALWQLCIDFSAAYLFLDNLIEESFIFSSKAKNLINFILTPLVIHVFTMNPKLWSIKMTRL